MKKYDTSYTIIVKVRSRSNINLVEVIFFSSAKSEILEIIKFESFDNDDFKNQLFNLIDEWWKKITIIDQSIANKKLCYIKHSNIHELYFIIKKIQLLSQVKSIDLHRIELGMSLYEINFFGNSINLSKQFNQIKILNNINIIENQCFLSLSNQ